jgi:para-aminobenzoate synthetase component 1
MLAWVNQFNIFCFLDNVGYTISPHQYECLLAAGITDSIISTDITNVDNFLARHKSWVFGHLAYDLKNSIYHFHSSKDNKIGFPYYHFFVPEYLLFIKNDQVEIFAGDPHKIYKEIIETVIEEHHSSSHLAIQQKLTKEEYLKKIRGLQDHILRGDCYEINFCQEFFAEEVDIKPLEIFQHLIELSPNPFAAFYKLDDKYLICASPERFLAKKGSRLISQPMKGTIKRDISNRVEDEKLKQVLMESAKDQSENVMVVDMVRNDLSRVCIDGSVKVDELFGVYTYPQVHQMISTISGELKPETTFSDIMAAMFPMGSMTGAPKYRVMELIEEYEVSDRGIFSGSIGYIDPEDNFDFNVVIRSIMYNSANKYLSYQVGSGITFYSDPEKEWEECLLKGEAIKKVLTSQTALSNI